MSTLTELELGGIPIASTRSHLVARVRAFGLEAELYPKRSMNFSARRNAILHTWNEHVFHQIFVRQQILAVPLLSENPAPKNAPICVLPAF